MTLSADEPEEVPQKSLPRDRLQYLSSIKKKEDNEKYTFQLKQTKQLDPAEKVFIYSSQSNNWYDKQMKDLRLQIAQDKNNFYTYSKDYLSLSIDPVDIKQKEKEEKKLKELVTLDF